MTSTQAIQALVNRAENLIHAIAGATDEFNAEIVELRKAIARVEHLLDGGVL